MYNFFQVIYLFIFIFIRAFFLYNSRVWSKEIMCYHGSFTDFLTKYKKDNAVCQDGLLTARS